MRRRRLGATGFSAATNSLGASQVYALSLLVDIFDGKTSKALFSLFSVPIPLIAALLLIARLAATPLPTIALREAESAMTGRLGVRRGTNGVLTLDDC